MHTKKLIRLDNVRHEEETLTVNFLEHPKHALQKVVVQKPHRRVTQIFLKWHSKAIGDVHSVIRPRAQQNTHHSLSGVFRYAIVVIRHGQQHQRVDDNLRSWIHSSGFKRIRY